jgi:hypothetical protein
LRLTLTGFGGTEWFPRSRSPRGAQKPFPRFSGDPSNGVLARYALNHKRGEP